MIRQVLGLTAPADCILIRPEVVYDKYVSSQDDLGKTPDGVYTCLEAGDCHDRVQPKEHPKDEAHRATRRGNHIGMGGTINNV